MKRRLLILYGGFLMLGAFCQSIPGQTAPNSLSANDQYRQVSQLMAQENYERAIAESKRLLEEFPNYYHGYVTLGLAAIEGGQLEPTRAWLESLLVRQPPQQKAYIGLALLCNFQNDFAGAIKYYHSYLNESPDDEAAVVMLAEVYSNKKSYAEGEAYFKSLLSAQANSTAGHLGLGVLYSLARRGPDAVTELDQVIALNPQNITAYSHKSYVLARAGRNPEATATLLICLSLLRANPDDFIERQVLNLLGDIYRRSGNYIEAATTFDRVLVLTRAVGDLPGEETSLGQLASVHYRQSRYVEALAYWHQALEVSKRISSRKSKLTTRPQRHRAGIGDVQARLGDLEAAERSYLESLSLSVEVKDETNQSSVLNALGDLYVELGKLSQALAIQEQALALGEKLGSVPNQLGALNSLSVLHRQMGHPEKAIHYVQRALKLLEGRTDPLWFAESHNNLGFLQLGAGKPGEALAAFEKTLGTERSATPPHAVWQAHSGAAVAYAQLAQLDKARENYQSAIDVMENVRARLGGEEDKAGYFADKIVVYKKLINLLLDPRVNISGSQNNAEAFHQVERARARAFLDMLTEAKVDIQQTNTPDLLKRREELQQRISQLTTQLIKERATEVDKQNQGKIVELERGLDKAYAELLEWLRELRRRNPSYAALKYPEPITLSETQRMLDEETVLLSYSLAEPESFLFAVSRNDFQIKRLPSEKTLDANVQDLLSAITDKNNPAPADYRRHAANLSQQLLQPVSRMLAGKRKLIVVADGALHRVPFEVLFQPGVPQRGDLRQWPFLVRQFAISYAPSASVLAELQKEPHDPAPKSFVAFGDPNYRQTDKGLIASTLRATSAGRLNFQPLPYSHTEIEGIAGLFAKDDRELFFQDAASEENVKAPNRLSAYRLVHFSTHGYVNEARPRFSGLVLSLPDSSSANPQSEDGLLAAYEIFNLKLKADLVVLSACETGLGKEVKGEGLMSLTRAFMYAGAPSVVVSLWNVNDQSAADLMMRFYRHLQAGKSKSEALRQAQLETIRDNGFPFFWAPFVLIGKP